MIRVTLKLTLISHNLPARLAASIEEGDVAAVLNVAFGPGGSYAVAFREPCSRECRLRKMSAHHLIHRADRETNGGLNRRNPRASSRPPILAVQERQQRPVRKVFFGLQ